jgi:hypothetical protein
MLFTDDIKIVTCKTCLKDHMYGPGAAKDYLKAGERLLELRLKKPRSGIDKAASLLAGKLAKGAKVHPAWAIEAVADMNAKALP